MEEPLRVKGSNTSIQSAWMIPHAGFGESQKISRCGNGAILSESRSNQYRLMCGCVVADPSDLGGVCEACLVEVMHQLGDQFSQEQLAWVATPCRVHHFRVCSAPFCGIGGCLKHIAEAPDGKFYCPPHFIDFEEAVRSNAIAEKYGWVGEKADKIFRSFFGK